MYKKIVQIILVLAIGLLLVSASPLSIIDEGDNGGERWYCGTTAFNPVEWGASVRGLGEIACTSEMSWLKIDVDIVDITGNRKVSESRTCYNTTSCDIAAYINTQYDHWYVTRASGYWPTSDWYDASDWVYITE